MTNATAYIEAATHYLDAADAAIIETLTDNQFAALVAACELQTGGGDEPGIDCGLVKTFETIADFDNSSKKWAEYRGRETEDCAGAAAVKWERVQMQKGMTRTDFTVVDLGEFRVVLTNG